MTDRSADPRKATARSPIAGCSILIVAVLVMVFLVVFSTITLFRQYNEIEKFTAESPVPVEVEPLEDRETELNRLAESIEIFRQQLQGEEEASLALSPEQINLAIAAYKPLEELRGTFRVEAIEDGVMRVAISFQLNGRPRLARDEEDGWITSDPRFLNGTLIARPRLLGGEIVLSIDEIEIPGGAEVPEGFIGQMSPYRITQRYVTDPEIGPAMKRLTSLELADGRMVLRRVPGEIPSDTITDEQVDHAAGRLFTVFAIGASIFLLLVGLVLFIGLRAKGRRA